MLARRIVLVVFCILFAVVTVMLPPLAGRAFARAHPRDDVVHLRFRLDQRALAAMEAHRSPIDAAPRPLFGDVDDVHAHALAGAPDLSTWFTLDCATWNVASAERDLAAAGAQEMDVEPRFELAAIARDVDDVRGDVSDVRDDGPSCPIKTPTYDDRQGYRDALEIDAARALPGGRGQGVSVADVEGEWNDKHEDLPGERITHVAGARQKTVQWRAHGTAVLGVIAARDNDAGMLGLVPDVDRIVTASLGRIGAARALYEAAKALSPGDVLIVELHGPGPNYRGDGQKGFVPMEWWQPEYDAIAWATKKGVVVVEAAGNGGEDLDDPIYKKRFDRGVRDSGAILVGAGAPPNWREGNERSRLDFSNYGARVDVQGWGRLVATLDYGDLQGCATPARDYTALFAGTSSASPVVAGAAIAVQGVAKARLGAPLSPVAMRTLLVDTGSAQDGDDEHIGPLPNVARAIAALGR